MKIGEIIKSGESETVEFKKSTGEWKEIIDQSLLLPIKRVE